VDAASRDDAAVFRLSEDRALVATVDFFAPIVDDAATWGAIAAANALSDLYAMGARPLFALSLVGWPREKLSFDLLGDVLKGAAKVARQAGCPIIGGHSIDALEPHFGLVAIGEAHPGRLLTVAGASAGEVLVLTKPLGTGILSTALKRGRITEAAMSDAVQSMLCLNEAAARAAVDQGVRAATDVTGFGLLGHLSNLTRASGVAAEIRVDRLPLLPGALALAREGVVPGGTTRNLENATNVTFADGIGEAERLLCADAQTSGGLLLAVPPDRREALLAALLRAGTPAAVEIGRLFAGPAGAIRVVRGD
jgi:selenide,water dikinase